MFELILALALIIVIVAVLAWRLIRLARRGRSHYPPAPQTWPCPACAEPIRVEADVCKHCGARMDDYDEQPAPMIAVAPSGQWTERRIGATVLVVILLVLWRLGTFDHLLVNVGLNAKECAHNGFGATYCGKELTEYRERLLSTETALERAARGE